MAGSISHALLTGQQGTLSLESDWLTSSRTEVNKMKPFWGCLQLSIKSCFGLHLFCSVLPMLTVTGLTDLPHLLQQLDAKL